MKCFLKVLYMSAGMGTASIKLVGIDMQHVERDGILATINIKHVSRIKHCTVGINLTRRNGVGVFDGNSVDLFHDKYLHLP